MRIEKLKEDIYLVYGNADNTGQILLGRGLVFEVDSNEESPLQKEINEKLFTKPVKLTIISNKYEEELHKYQTSDAYEYLNSKFDFMNNSSVSELQEANEQIFKETNTIAENFFNCVMLEF